LEFLKILSSIFPSLPNKKKIFPLLQILFFDDEGGSIEAFVGKSVASAHVDLYKSLSAAMVAFSGDLASVSSLKSLQLVQEIEEQTQGVLCQEEIEKILHEKLEKGDLLYGFGHPSLCVEDPRATLLYNFARNHYPDHPLVKIALHLRYEAPRILAKSFPNISSPFANVHAISGVLLESMGVVKKQYYPLLFALARSVGVVIQILHETAHANRSALVHPHYFYRLM
jgi:citrate synthase